jgi:Uma2 family endonuclease
MNTAAELMTVDQFRQLADPPGAYLELRNGETVAATRPKLKRYRIQSRLLNLLRKRGGEDFGFVGIELAFRADRNTN